MSTTTAYQEAAAVKLLNADHYTANVSISLPADIVVDLLIARGWNSDAERAWVSPSGERYWSIDEALTVALLAETYQTVEQVMADPNYVGSPIHY